VSRSAAWIQSRAGAAQFGPVAGQGPGRDAAVRSPEPAGPVSAPPDRRRGCRERGRAAGQWWGQAPMPRGPLSLAPAFISGLPGARSRPSPAWRNVESRPKARLAAPAAGHQGPLQRQSRPGSNRSAPAGLLACRLDFKPRRLGQGSGTGANSQAADRVHDPHS